MLLSDDGNPKAIRINPSDIDNQGLISVGAPVVIFMVVAALAAWLGTSINRSADDVAALTSPGGPVVWYSVLPPLLAITAAIATRRLFTSFSCAILLGVILSAFLTVESLTINSWFQAFAKQAINVVKTTIGITSESEANAAAPTISLFNGQVIAFVILILAMISVLMVSGGLQGVVRSISKLAKGRRSTQLITILAGLMIFIDDYANTMIVGSAMRPITDHKQISREKLAFLVDATTAPVAGVAFISTWIGFELWLFSNVAESTGIARDSYSMFLDTLRFRFYCLMMILFVLLNALTGRDFAAMRRAEMRAANTGKLLEDDAVPMTSQVLSTLSHDPNAHISAFSAIIPIAALFITIFTAFWIFGNSQDSILSWATWRAVISEVSSQEKNLTVLAIASGIGLLTAILCSLIFARLQPLKIAQAVLFGLRGGLLPTVVLLLAWALKSTCDTLHTSYFLAQTVGSSIPPHWFPAVVFLLASLTSFTTGTSWGTMMLLIPTVVPIAFQLDGYRYGLTTTICLGAVLDGSIFGDHCSPISDTTIMSSISSSCDHLHHVRTQMPYSLTVAAMALLIGYLPAAFGMPSWICFVLATALMFIIFRFFGKELT
ncbi:hypothetical protein CMK14_22405 [Candidatus Poribacteria bacterium]|nr:hypothetical protein [Candidatus Poribacteria bacterium]